jgi:hypothetical protein
VADSGGDRGLNARQRARLEPVFLATTYRIHADEGPIDLRIGQPSPALEVLLDRHGASAWAFISAANPRAAQAPDSVNAQRHDELRAVLQTQGHVPIEGHGVPASEGWRPEPSWFVLDIPIARAKMLARRFDQLALVAGIRHGTPRLIWC